MLTAASPGISDRCYGGGPESAQHRFGNAGAFGLRPPASLGAEQPHPPEARRRTIGGSPPQARRHSHLGFRQRVESRLVLVAQRKQHRPPEPGYVGSSPTEGAAVGARSLIGPPSRIVPFTRRALPVIGCPLPSRRSNGPSVRSTFVEHLVRGPLSPRQRRRWPAEPATAHHAPNVASAANGCRIAERGHGSGSDVLIAEKLVAAGRDGADGLKIPPPRQCPLPEDSEDGADDEPHEKAIRREGEARHERAWSSCGSTSSSRSAPPCSWPPSPAR